jgi:hypothetical protein
MPHLDWQTWVAIAQVLSTLLAGIGIIVSMWIGIRTLREVRDDRLHRVRPKLLFNYGGQEVPCELREALGIPGIDFEYARTLLSDKPPGARHCLPKHLWKGLTNYGNGSALNAAITFVTKTVEKAGEEFAIDEKKLTEFPYTPELNHAHIAPGQSSEFFRLPTPVTLDFSEQLTSMTAEVLIQYEDTYGNEYETVQELRVTVKRERDSARVWLTFGDEIEKGRVE